MKRKLLFLATLAASALGFNANAQTTTDGPEDVTGQYLTNANLSSLDGWSYGDSFNNSTYEYTAWKSATDDVDVPVIEFYHSWSPNAGQPVSPTKNFHFTQKANLPAGNYRIQVNAFYREGNGNGQNNNKAWIFAGDKKQNVIGLEAEGIKNFTATQNAIDGDFVDLSKAANAFSLGNFSNEFDFEVEADGEETVEVELGFRGFIDTYNSWCILGPVKLYKYSLDDYLVAYREKVAEAEALYNKNMNTEVLNDLKSAVLAESSFTKSAQITEQIAILTEKIAAANTSIKNYEAIKTVLDAASEMSEEVQKLYAEADVIKELQKGYDEGTLEAITDEQKTKANEALIAAIKGQTTIAENTDMTICIVNADLNNGETGWEVYKPNGGNGPKNGNLFEYWNANAIDGLFNYYQQITGLPNGVYTISADMYNSRNGQEATVNGECGVYGATATAEVFAAVTEEGETLKTYTTGEIVVTDGTLTVGVKNIATMSARWFEVDNFKLTYVKGVTEEEIAAQPAKDKAAALATAATYNDAKMVASARKALNEAEDAEALWVAINNARESIMLYNRIKANIDLVKKYSSEGYATMIDEKYNNEELTSLDDPQDLHYSYTIEKLVEENATDYTSAILNAAIANGDFWNGAILNNGQQYTGAPDNTYLDANTGTLNASQIVKGLPAGKYSVKVATRASTGLTDGHIYISVNGTDLVSPQVNKDGNANGELGNGWSWTTADFELSRPSDVRFGIYSQVNGWLSVDDWHLTYVSDEVKITEAEYTAYVTTFDTDFTRTDGVTAYKVTDANTSYVTLEKIETAPANTAVVLSGNANTYTIMQAKEAVGEVEGNLFEAGGTKKGDGSTIYALGDIDGVGFYLVANDLLVPANKGYLEIKATTSDPNGVKTFIPLGDGETTGIEAVETKGDSEATVIYNLAGQRVVNPTNGIYIVNGKKVLISK